MKNNPLTPEQIQILKDLGVIKTIKVYYLAKKMKYYTIILNWGQ